MTDASVPTALDVVTLGEAMALFLAEPLRGVRGARTFTRSIAGAETNIAIGLRRLGRPTGWIGRVGDDPLGHATLDVLRAEAVDVSQVVVDAEAPTGLLIRDQHPERTIEVLYYRSRSAGSRLRADDIDPGYVARARLLHLTGITPGLSGTACDATRRAFELARERGLRVSFDPNLRAKIWDGKTAARTLEPFLAADVVLTGLAEGEALSSRSGRRDVASWFLDHGAKLVAVKEGRAGAWATDGDATWECPARPVTVADPVGAGDAFAAGFLHGWLDGHGVDDCLTLGTRVAGLALQSPGDFEGLPYRPELDHILAHEPDVDR